MTRIFSARILAALCLMLSAGFLASCDKENDVSTAVELLSFGPTGAMHGDTLRFIGNNLDKVTAIEFTGATVPKSEFVAQSPEEIRVKVPAGAEQGFVKLKLADGEIVSKTKLNLSVEASVTSFTPEARPGENITISGNYLNWVKRITFARDKVVETFVSQSINQLVVTVPADAQTGPLVLFYGGTDSMDVQTEDTLKVTLPVAASLAPNPTKHQQNLTITGTNLDLAKQVIFTGVTSPVTSFVSQSATELVVNVPAAARKGRLKLVAASGVATETATELEVLLPVISSLSPNPVDPETNLTITGSNLDLVTAISFVGAAAKVTAFESQTPTQIVVKVPAGTLKGKLTFDVDKSTLTVQSDVLDITGGLPPLADFPLPIFTDALQNGFQNWSYTDTKDFASTEIVRQGTASIKAVYGGNGYQGITFHHNSGVSTAGYTKLEFSVFGTAGTGGKKLNMVINGNYSGPPQVTIVEGEWTTFSVDLSTLGSPATFSELVLQSAGWTGTIHIDHVGLR